MTSLIYYLFPLTLLSWIMAVIYLRCFGITKDLWQLICVTCQISHICLFLSFPQIWYAVLDIWLYYFSREAHKLLFRVETSTSWEFPPKGLFELFLRLFVQLGVLPDSCVGYFVDHIGSKKVVDYIKIGLQNSIEGLGLLSQFSDPYPLVEGMIIRPHLKKECSTCHLSHLSLF